MNLLNQMMMLLTGSRFSGQFGISQFNLRTNLRIPLQHTKTHSSIRTTPKRRQGLREICLQIKINFLFLPLIAYRQTPKTWLLLARKFAILPANNHTLE